MVRLYDQLQDLASRYLRHEAPFHVLETNALVHEAYLRLARLRAIQWQGKAHFMAVAATQMRRVLVEHARAERAAKRGGRLMLVALDEAIASPAEPSRLFEVHQALQELGRRHERRERVAELRLISGLTFKETASTIGCSERTAREDWTVARSWLCRRLRPGNQIGGPHGGPLCARTR